jgi:hypothetical protein
VPQSWRPSGFIYSQVLGSCRHLTCLYYAIHTASPKAELCSTVKPRIEMSDVVCMQMHALVALQATNSASGLSAELVYCSEYTYVMDGVCFIAGVSRRWSRMTVSVIFFYWLPSMGTCALRHDDELAGWRS